MGTDGRPTEGLEIISQAASAPDRTRSLLLAISEFRALSANDLTSAANTLTFVFSVAKEWRRVASESVSGPARFKDGRTMNYGLSKEAAEEVTRTVGLSGGADLKLLVANASREWTTMTQTTLNLHLEVETTREVEFQIDAPGATIERWQRFTILTRRLRLRPGADLPPDPLPRWVELAVAMAVTQVEVPSDETYLARVPQV